MLDICISGLDFDWYQQDTSYYPGEEGATYRSASTVAECRTLLTASRTFLSVIVTDRS